jgi:hypothetical protein
MCVGRAAKIFYRLFILFCRRRTPPDAVGRYRTLPDKTNANASPSERGREAFAFTLAVAGAVVQL